MAEEYPFEWIGFDLTTRGLMEYHPEDQVVSFQLDLSGAAYLLDMSTGVIISIRKYEAIQKIKSQPFF